MYLPIYYNGSIVSQLPVYDALMIERQLMNADKIQAEIEVPGVLNCPIGSYIIFQGRHYTVNTIPGVEKTSTRMFRYSITFESDLYRLFDKILEHLNNMTFQYYGSPVDYANLVVENINMIDSGWTVGVCDDAPEVAIDFVDESCRTVLDKIAENFKFEWDLLGRELRFVKQVGNVTTHTFEYGRGRGLYSLAYQYRSDKNIVTKAFGRGSSRNLPENYRGGITQLAFEGLFLTKNVNVYREKQGVYTNDQIFPKVEGTVTAFSTYDENAGAFTITDSGLAFNLKDNFTSETPKISFLTGELQGQEFEILDYNNTTKTIKIKVFTDGSNNKLPNAVFQAAVGDTYTLFDMLLPDEAVNDAEERLRAATQIWLDENCIPNVVFSLELDPLYARDNGIILNKGDKIRVVDVQLGIDAMIRVNSTSYPVLFPDTITPDTKISIMLSNDITYTLEQRLLKADITNQKEIKIVNRTSAEKARLNSLNLRTLQGRIFNPDGSLFDGPDSLIAGMAAFGYDSQNFNLNDVIIKPNATGDPNALSISAGKLVHYVYKIDGLGYIWNLTANTWAALDPLKFYYVYAKCNTSSLSGTWELSETPVAVNDIPGFYTFNLGILYEVNSDGYRVFQSTKGVTTIVGDQITSGLIQDVTGQNYINLSNGQFNMGNAESGMDWDVTTPDTLTIRGFTVSKVVEVGSDGAANARISGITDPINPGKSIRFAAGENDEYKVLDDGGMFATSGKIGNWNITNDGLENLDGSGAYMRWVKSHAGGALSEMAIGRSDADVWGRTGGILGYFVNNEPGTDLNTAIYAKASGATQNIAIEADGDVSISNGNLFLAGQMTVLPPTGGSAGLVFLKNLPTVDNYNGKNTLVIDSITGQLFRLV
jgi:hypothetical protein